MTDEPFHGGVDLVKIERYSRFDILRVVGLVYCHIAVLPHILYSISPDLEDILRDRSYLNLVRRPRVHAEGLDFGDMCAQFPVQRGTSHAQEHAQLFSDSVSFRMFVYGFSGMTD